jgi:uncharacterized membrane protein HdeD (DUF308 family)
MNTEASTPSLSLDQTDGSEAMTALLAQNWGVVALRGVLTIIFGVIALLWPGITMASLVILFSAYMLVDGVLAIVSGIRMAHRHERWWLLTLEGIADIAAGVIAFLWPGITILAFVYLAAAWAIISGIFMIAAAFRLRRTHGRWLMGIGGIVSIIWGVLVSIVPVISAIVMTWWIGAYAIVFGAALIGLALRLRRGPVLRAT